MRTGHILAATAGLIGDPARANMLAALLDGRALTAGELAFVAGVAAPTASAHLAKLVAGGLLRVAKQGRHRYFALASVEVARMLESVMVVAGHAPPERRVTPRIPAGLVECRRCYDHMAGRLAVALADALVLRGDIVLDADAGLVTQQGQIFFGRIGLAIDVPRGRRLLCRPCLDWSERRPHLAGRLGSALLDFAIDRDWVRRAKEGRALTVTAEGRQGFGDLFGVALPEDRSSPQALLRTSTRPSSAA